MFTNCRLLLSSYCISPIVVWLCIFRVSVKHAEYDRGNEGRICEVIASLWQFLSCTIYNWFFWNYKLLTAKCVDLFIHSNIINFLLFQLPSWRKQLKNDGWSSNSWTCLIFCSSLNKLLQVFVSLSTVMSSLNWFLSLSVSLESVLLNKLNRTRVCGCTEHVNIRTARQKEGRLNLPYFDQWLCFEVSDSCGSEVTGSPSSGISKPYVGNQTPRLLVCTQ